MSASDGFGATYVCREGTALHAVLVEAHRRGASDVHVTDEGTGSDRRPCLRFRVNGSLSDHEDAPCDARQMLTELVRLPPKGLTDPAMVLIHALTNDAGPARDLSFEAVIGGATLRGRLAYETSDLRGTSRLVARLLPTRLTSRPDTPGD